MSMLRSLVVRHLPLVRAPLRALGALPPARSLISSTMLSVLGSSTTPRPRAYSMRADWTSWESLTDRTFSGRHLPPVAVAEQRGLPAEADVVGLFRRTGAMRPSSDTSVLFMFFAQWFTDSFLRTDRSDHRRNTSNHEIDLCQIYGLTPVQTRLLRSGTSGRLKTQTIRGQSYPPYLFQPRSAPGEPLVVKPEFAGLHDAAFLVDRLLEGAPEAHKDAFFAVGLEHGNSTVGSAMLDVLFVREHNRIAGLLAEEHEGDPEWSDDRLFDTTRNILTVLLLELVVEEYIAHISPLDFPLQLVRSVADGAPWNRSNWCAIEFNLLYRWHSLVPDGMRVAGEDLDAGALRNNNPLLLREGVEAVLAAASGARAGRIGLLNTPAFMVDEPRPGVPSVEARTVDLMRRARLQSYNDYREHFGLRRLRSFGELTTDPTVQARLRKLYDTVDEVEWYVGIFAEDYPDHAMMGELLTVMVGYDAVTQALTNPLLARNVYNADTFTRTGLRIIDETVSLQQVVDRNVAEPARARASFRWHAAPRSAGPAVATAGAASLPGQRGGDEPAARAEAGRRR